MPPPNSNNLKIAIIGFDSYARFLANIFVSQGHTVLAHSTTDHRSLEAHSIGVSFFLEPHQLCEQNPDVILLCTSVISTKQVLKSLPLHRLKRDILFVDFLSVKKFGKSLLLHLLPSDFDIICTHPMCGLQRSNFGRDGLHFVYENVRVRNEKTRIDRCKSFLYIFAREGCNLVEMSCEDQDKYAAESQFITHTAGRVVQMLNLKSTPINTKGYESLLDLVDDIAGDTFDLYFGLFIYNKNALEMLEKLDMAFGALRNQLFGRLHEVVRNQLFGNGEKGKVLQLSYANRQGNGAAKPQGSEYAAQPFEHNPKLKIAVVGFGNFGQFLAKRFVQQGHTILAYSRSDYSVVARELGITYFSDADDLCEEHPEVILLCTSILSTENVLKSLPLQRLKRSTLFVDVLSVKEFPRNLFLQYLPSDFDILCTHPMFGPESGKNGWNALPFVFDKVRVGSSVTRISRCDRFLDIFAREGCRMVEMSCAEHDRHAAGSQFITHTMGRILEKLQLGSTPINTRGYEILLKLVKNTAGDSLDLYYGLFVYNVNAMEQLERLGSAFESLKKQLFGQLYGVLRNQLLEDSENSQVLREELPSELSQNDAALEHLAV